MLNPTMIRKAQPTQGDVHVNRPLTNISIMYRQATTNFVAHRVFPGVGVPKQSDSYFLFDRTYFFRAEAKKRAPGTESAGAGYGVSTASYKCDVWALHHDVDDQRRANTDDPLAPDRNATQLLSQQMLLTREKEWTSTFFAAGVWGQDWDGVAAAPNGTTTFLQWNDAASTPIEDVRFGKTTVLEKTGFEPNVLVLGRRVYDKLVDHPDIIDRLKYNFPSGQPTKVTAQMLAALFEVEEVLVMNAVENSAVEGAAGSYAFIGGKKALLTFRNPAPALEMPSAGYIMGWTGYTGAGPMGERVSRFRMEHLRSDRIEHELAFDMHLVANVLGVFWDTIVA